MPSGDAEQQDFEEFVAARMPALLRTAYLLTGGHHDAEDLVQTALIKAVPAWSRIVGDPEPYVRRILVRENISRWRGRRWREVSSATPPEIAGYRDAIADHAERDRVLAALRALPPRQRTVIVLRYYEDRTEAEIAALMGIRPGTVKSTARDALRSLRDLLPALSPSSR